MQPFIGIKPFDDGAFLCGGLIDMVSYSSMLVIFADWQLLMLSAKMPRVTEIFLPIVVVMLSFCYGPTCRRVAEVPISGENGHIT